MSNFRRAVKAARNFLKQHSPAWLNVEVDRDFFKNFAEAIAHQQRSLAPVSYPALQRKPHWRRIALVYAILDRATEEGIVSYTALVNRVREVTGKGCSRKLISKWKLERGLRQS